MLFDEPVNFEAVTIEEDHETDKQSLKESQAASSKEKSLLHAEEEPLTKGTPVDSNGPEKPSVVAFIHLKNSMMRLEDGFTNIKSTLCREDFLR